MQEGIMLATHATTLIKCALLVCGLVLTSMLLQVAKTYGELPLMLAAQ
jgi:hypothetical protein